MFSLKMESLYVEGHVVSLLYKMESAVIPFSTHACSIQVTISVENIVIDKAAEKTNMLENPWQTMNFNPVSQQGMV